MAWNLAAPEANVCRRSIKHVLKIFTKLTEKDLCRNLFLKHPGTLKEGSGTSVFLWILDFFEKHLFCRVSSDNCFYSLKNYSGSLESLPLECW